MQAIEISWGKMIEKRMKYIIQQYIFYKQDLDEVNADTRQY